MPSLPAASRRPSPDGSPRRFGLGRPFAVTTFTGPSMHSTTVLQHHGFARCRIVSHRRRGTRPTVTENGRPNAHSDCSFSAVMTKRWALELCLYFHLRHLEHSMAASVVVPVRTVINRLDCRRNSMVKEFACPKCSSQSVVYPDIRADEEFVLCRTCGATIATLCQFRKLVECHFISSGAHFSGC